MKCATVPIADPTHHELVSKAVGLQPLLRKHAVAGDAARTTADEVVDSLTEAGFFRLHTPRKFDGMGHDLPEPVWRPVVEALAENFVASGTARRR
jgi:3-hydroxy-9,10-secoandrosta-1,3,5(10)-triene-9,17-dione monooxygenase